MVSSLGHADGSLRIRHGHDLGYGKGGPEVQDGGGSELDCWR